VTAAIAAHAPAGGVPYRLKVVAKWNCLLGHDDDAEDTVMYISMPPITVIPGPAANTMNEEQVRLGDLFARIRVEQAERVDHVRDFGSAIEFVKIEKVEFIFMPTPMARRVIGAASGSAGARVKLPTDLLKKRCCINIDNTDGFCFIYAAICLGNKTYAQDNSSRSGSALYLQNPRRGGSCPKNFKPTFREIVINEKVVSFDMLEFPP